MYLFVDGAGLDKLVGQAVTTVIVTVLTFFINRAWTFSGSCPDGIRGDGRRLLAGGAALHEPV